MTRAVVSLVVVLCAGLALAGCGGDDRAVAWRDLDLTLPEGWVVVNDYDDALYVSDGSMGQGEGEAGERDGSEVGVQFQQDTSTADDWRDLAAERGWTVERDQQVEVDGLPATLLQFSSSGDADNPPTREQVVIVPSRSLVILSQAVPVQGQTDAPEVFDAHVDEFEFLQDSIDFGAPEDYVQ